VRRYLESSKCLNPKPTIFRSLNENHPREMMRASRMNAEEREWVYNELEVLKHEKKDDFKVDDFIPDLIKAFRDKFGDYRLSVINPKKIKEINSGGPLSRSAKAKVSADEMMNDLEFNFRSSYRLFKLEFVLLYIINYCIY
jgi:hypothetical protein